MSTTTDTTRLRWLVTLVWGVVASAAIWLVGAHDVAYLGFILVALAREAGGRRACSDRLPRERRP